MESANQPLLQEMLPRPRSETYAACFGAAILPTEAVFARDLGFCCLFDRVRRSWESSPEAPEGVVVFSCLFRLSPVQGRVSGLATESRSESSGRSPWFLPPKLFLFHSTHSLLQIRHCFFQSRLSLFQPTRSLFHQTPSRVRPVPLFVQQAVVQRWKLACGRSKSSQKRRVSKGTTFFSHQEVFRNSRQQNGSLMLVK